MTTHKVGIFYEPEHEKHRYTDDSQPDRPERVSSVRFGHPPHFLAASVDLPSVFPFLSQGREYRGYIYPIP